MALLALWEFFASSAAFGEVQTTLNMTVPSLTVGNSGAFSSSQASGPTGTNSGTVTQNFAGVSSFTQTAGTGRFATYNGTTRYGLNFDGFQFFQSFISSNYFTVVSSNTTCPGDTTYQWMMVRLRTPDAPRSPMSTGNSNLKIGGTFTYNSTTSTFTGTNYFDIYGPTLTSSPTYGINAYNSIPCASGKNKGSATGTSSLDAFQYIYYGARSAVIVSADGNPEVILAVPQQTLSSGTMTSLSNYVFTGLYTYYSSPTVQTQNNVYLYPDAAGTTFTLRRATSLTDPSSYSTLGTLTCTSLNSPTTGFCKGTLTLNGVSGSGNAICMVSPNSTENLIACSAQYPADNRYPVTFIGKTEAKVSTHRLDFLLIREQ
jgi:hypothetical protein